MKFCPKCRSFYDDAGLAFCLADGVPLVEMNQTDALWNEGTEAVSYSRQVFRQQMRKEKLIRISKLLVTVLIMIMVISVVAIKIYKYTNPPEETPKAVTPTATVESRSPITVQASVSPSETPLDCNCNNNCSVNKTINCNCNTNCDVIATNNCNCNNNCSVNRASNCGCNKNCEVEVGCDCQKPCKSNTSEKCKSICDCVTPDKCPQDETLIAIKKDNFQKWYDDINSGKQKIKDEFILEMPSLQNFKDQVEVKLNFNIDQIEFSKEPTCQQAIVSFDYSWELQKNPRFKLNKYTKDYTGTYTCTRSNTKEKWKCTKK